MEPDLLLLRAWWWCSALLLLLVLLEQLRQLLLCRLLLQLLLHLRWMLLRRGRGETASLLPAQLLQSCRCAGVKSWDLARQHTIPQCDELFCSLGHTVLPAREVICVYSQRRNHS